jgi:uncharacterized protein YndB with AHSA1/START domain
MKQQALELDRNNYIQIARRFDASTERVFDAWLDPKIASRWLFTSPASLESDFDLDVRVGGKWRISDRCDDTEYAAIGEYLAIDRPHRLVFTFAMPQFSLEYDRVIVDIAPDGDGCILTLTEEGLPPSYEGPSKNGWSSMFNDLAAALNWVAPTQGHRPMCSSSVAVNFGNSCPDIGC